MALCGQNPISSDIWEKIIADGVRYCLLFEDGKPVARACIEKLSDKVWEVSDVRTAREYRSRRFAYNICTHVKNSIIDANRTASIRTEEDNFAMQAVIKKLGFAPSQNTK